MSRREFYNLRDPSQGNRRLLAPGLSARIFTGDRVMLSVVTIAANAEGTIHHHPEEQWGVLLEGSGIRSQRGEEIQVGPGDLWRTPGGVLHGFRGGPDGALIIDIFSPPREDYRGE